LDGDSLGEPDCRAVTGGQAGGKVAAVAVDRRRHLAQTDPDPLPRLWRPVFEKVEELPNHRRRPDQVADQAGTLARLEEGEPGGAEVVEVADAESLGLVLGCRRRQRLSRAAVQVGHRRLTVGRVVGHRVGVESDTHLEHGLDRIEGSEGVDETVRDRADRPHRAHTTAIQTVARTLTTLPTSPSLRGGPTPEPAAGNETRAPCDEAEAAAELGTAPSAITGRCHAKANFGARLTR
jgi:hypothetical protein